jgi:type I site-specific restriction endonuclease
VPGITEADTCRKYVLPKLIAAGWDSEPHSFTEQRTFTDGRIIVSGGKVRRGKQKRADYLLRYTRDFTIAVVEWGRYRLRLTKVDIKKHTPLLKELLEKSHKETTGSFEA